MEHLLDYSRNCNKEDKQEVSIIGCEKNSINVIADESLKSYYKSRFWLLLCTQAGFACSLSNKKTQGDQQENPDFPASFCNWQLSL